MWPFVYFENIGAQDMNNTQSLKLNKEFKRLYYRGKSYANSYLIIYFLKNWYNPDEKRLGITVNKKIGKAVKRNYIRRRIKEAYRLFEIEINDGYDIVFVARKRLLLSEYSEYVSAMWDLLKKASLLKKRCL